MALLQIEDIRVSFGGLAAVDGTSLSLEKGQILGLIGPNGAGKTTLFNTIGGVVKPSSGRILFEGEDITGLPAHELYKRGIVRTFQLPHEFGKLTVRENLLAMAPDQPGERLLLNWLQPGRCAREERKAHSKALETLEFLGLTARADAPGAELSGGQKKLLELGRILMRSPKLILLDEPAAGVSPAMRDQIAKLIDRLHHDLDCSFCIVEHDMDFVGKLCDPIIVMREGRVLCQGTMEEIRLDDRVIDAYMGA